MTSKLNLSKVYNSKIPILTYDSLNKYNQIIRFPNKVKAKFVNFNNFDLEELKENIKNTSKLT